MGDDCGICCEGFNKSNHKKVDCPFCDLEVCRACVQRYLLETSNDPHCMGCKRAWDREVVDEGCTKTFRNKQLKEHRETILMERERCLLPETQPLVERRLHAIALEQQVTEVTKQIRNLYRQRERLQEEVYQARYNRILPPGEKKREFIRKCPVEDCRGFLSTAWKCGICENKICPECNEVKGEDHECDPANVETVKLLKKDTKPCPKCGTLIFKISGCSQMWCPDCHTAFCWNTGRIETGIIHNPHYYEFQRQHGTRGRNHGDIPCGGMPTLNELRRAVRNDAIICGIHRGIIHIQEVELRWHYPEPQPIDNTELRIQFMLKAINETYMKQVLQKREKAYAKQRDIRGILQMVGDTGGDLLRQVVLDPGQLQESLKVLEQLRVYYNGTIQKVANRYNGVVPFLSPSWNVIKSLNNSV